MNEARAPQPQAGAAVASDPAPNHEPKGQQPSGPNPLVSLLHKAAEAPGLDVIYEALGLVAEHFHLDDAAIVVVSETLGRQAFRLGRQPLNRALLEAFEGGAKFISTPDRVPSQIQHLVSGISEVALATHVAQRQLVRDPSTGLLSRGVFNEALRSAAAQSSRYGWIFTVMVMRASGDEPSETEVRRLGYAFGRALRSGDTGGRLRGATFTALLPNASAESLHALVGRFSDESGVPVESVQFASSTAPKDSVDPAELFRLAASRLHEG
jgi:GGDEF domain-containing protein